MNCVINYGWVFHADDCKKTHGADGSGHGIDSAGGIPFVLEVEGNGVPAYGKRDKGAQHKKQTYFSRSTT